MVEYWKTMILDSWAIYKRNLTLFLTYGISMLVGIWLISNYVLLSLNSEIFNLIFQLLIMGFSLGFLKIIIDLTEKSNANINDIIVGFNYLPKILVPFVAVIMLMQVILLLPLVVSGLLALAIIIIAFFLLFFYPVILIKKKLTLIDSLKMSARIGMDNVVKIIILSLIAGFIILIYVVITNLLMIVIAGGDFSTADSTTFHPNLVLVFVIITYFFLIGIFGPIFNIMQVKLYDQISKDSNISMVDDFENQTYESNS